MKNKLICCFILLFIIGCNKVPFIKTAYTQLENKDPRAVVEDFKIRVPDAINLFGTIVFEYNWKKISALWQLKADTKKEKFTILCLNPLGVKIFEIFGDKDEITSGFVIEWLAKKRNFINIVGKDIRNAYFNLIPPYDSKFRLQKDRISFISENKNGTTEYIFAGTDANLISKKNYRNGNLICKVDYYEYQVKDNKLYPRGIILENADFGYRLIITLKKIL